MEKSTGYGKVRKWEQVETNERGLISTSLYLPESLAIKASRIGGGNRSEGVRIALEAFDESCKKTGGEA